MIKHGVVEATSTSTSTTSTSTTSTSSTSTSTSTSTSSAGQAGHADRQAEVDDLDCVRVLGAKHHVL